MKCIYIDPPYNTGAEHWTYNDNVNSAEIRNWLGRIVGGRIDGAAAGLLHGDRHAVERYADVVRLSGDLERLDQGALDLLVLPDVRLADSMRNVLEARVAVRQADQAPPAGFGFSGRLLTPGLCSGNHGEFAPPT